MGDKKNTRVINNTSEDMKIRVNRGYPNPPKDYDIEAGKHRDINGTKFDGSNSSEKLPSVMIYCDERSLLSNKSKKWWLGGEVFFRYKTVTIVQVPGNPNSPERVEYEVKLEDSKQPASASTPSTKKYQLFRDRDLLLERDNGWYVQHCDDGIVKLTREEGMTMTLDPSKLFASNIVPDPETPLLKVVLKFWPRTFADLNCNDNLKTTIGIVNGLMSQAKLCHNNESNVQLHKEAIKKNVSELHNSCAALVEWYRLLFLTIEFPKVVQQEGQIADPEKLMKFETTISKLCSGTAESHD